jgi:hypothetical protein
MSVSVVLLMNGMPFWIVWSAAPRVKASGPLSGADATAPPVGRRQEQVCGVQLLPITIWARVLQSPPVPARCAVQVPPACDRRPDQTGRLLVRTGRVGAGLADHVDRAVAGGLEVDVVVGLLVGREQGRELDLRPVATDRGIVSRGDVGEVVAVVGPRRQVVVVAPHDADLVGAEGDHGRLVVAVVVGDWTMLLPTCDGSWAGCCVHRHVRLCCIGPGRCAPDGPQVAGRSRDRHGRRAAAGRVRHGGGAGDPG